MVPSVFGEPAVASPGRTRAAASQAPAVGPHGGGGGGGGVGFTHLGGPGQAGAIQRARDREDAVDVVDGGRK